MKSLSPRERVIELIKTLDEAETSFNPGKGNGGVLLMPTLYSAGSYAELELRLDAMRDSAQWRQAWWHVTQRYLNGVIVGTEVSYRRTLQGPQPNIPGRSELLFVESILSNRQMKVRLYCWDRRVDEALVEQGLSRLLATMYGGETQRIQLPLEFLYRALGKEMPDAATQGHQPRKSHVSTEALAVA